MLADELRELSYGVETDYVDKWFYKYEGRIKEACVDNIHKRSCQMYIPGQLKMFPSRLDAKDITYNLQEYLTKIQNFKFASIGFVTLENFQYIPVSTITNLLSIYLEW